MTSLANKMQLLAEYMCQTSYKTAWENYRIITTSNRKFAMINDFAWKPGISTLVLSCALSRDDGSYFPQEYLHLTDK